MYEIFFLSILCNCFWLLVFSCPTLFLTLLRLCSKEEPAGLAACLSPSPLPSISIVLLGSSPYVPLPSQDGWHWEWRGRKVQVLVNLLIGNHSAQDKNAYWRSGDH